MKRGMVRYQSPKPIVQPKTRATSLRCFEQLRRGYSPGLRTRRSSLTMREFRAHGVA